MPAELDTASSAPVGQPAAPPSSPEPSNTQALRRSAPWIAGFAALAFVGAGVSALALRGAGEPSETAVSTAPGESVQIALNPALPPPVVASAPGKLEVLPAYLAAAAPTPPEPPPRPAAYDAPQEAWTPGPGQPVANAPVANALGGNVGGATGGGRCAGARSLAEDMVCEDAQLAADDRRLNRAYRAALSAGIVPPDVLRADQRDWLDIREQAARRSIRAVEDVYRQRIAELEDVSG